jgi:hypothetical protein
MVLSSSIEQWFRREGETSWHVNSTSDPVSLCGQTRMRNNVDSTADALPFGATACAPCDAIRSGRTDPKAIEPENRTRARRQPKPQ